MPRPKKQPDPAKPEPKTDPIRVSKNLVQVIRLVAAASGMSVPEWIESRLTPIAYKELDKVPDRAQQLKKSAD